MKEPIYWTLICRWTERGSYAILAVTSERNNRINGRILPREEPTHTVRRDTKGRFETLEAAQAKVEEIRAIAEKHKPLIEAANRTYLDAFSAERLEIDRALGESS